MHMAVMLFWKKMWQHWDWNVWHHTITSIKHGLRKWHLWKHIRSQFHWKILLFVNIWSDIESWLCYFATLILWYPPSPHIETSAGSTGWRKTATVYPKKYAHGFVVLCFVVVMQSFIMNSHEVFIHIHQGCFAGTGEIVRLPQCQWSKPDGYGKIGQCITTIKHSKAKTACIILGIYCRDMGLLPFQATCSGDVYCYYIYQPDHCMTARIIPYNGKYDESKPFKIFSFEWNCVFRNYINYIVNSVG